MKKYFIKENKKKVGPYDVYKLKDIGIKSDTQISTTDDANWYSADDFSELRHIIEENPKKKIDYEKDRFFGHRLAESSDRWRGYNSLGLYLLPLSAFLVFIFIYFDIDIKKDGFNTFIFIISALVLSSSFQIYNIIKYSSPFGGKNSKLKLISSDEGKYIHEIAKNDFQRAFNISLKYSFLLFSKYTSERKTQTFGEKVAKVYLIKI